jgi:DNA-binding CsgD family transcriptional regulator
MSDDNEVERSWPLVGRADELGRMGRLLSNGARGLVLAGGAGVGKTRLAQELVEQAERAGAHVVRLTATRAATPLPFGVFAPFLPAVHHGQVAGVDDRADQLRRCIAFLLETAGARRLVLFADDAHLLDDASATLVQQLVTNSLAFVVSTVRSDEPAPDPIVALWKNDAVERLEVAELALTAVHELLVCVLGGPIDQGAVHRLGEACGGNVLFLRELVLGALEDGTLRDDGGVWRLVGTFAPSPRLTWIVEARLAGMSAEERSLLEVLSIGEPLGTSELTQLADPAVAEELERRGIVVSRADGRRLELRLAHPLYGDVLRARTPALRSRQIAGRLADVVESLGARRREDVLRVARWRLEGGTVDPDLMLEAATMARWLYDFPLAERLALAAQQAGAGFEAALLVAQLVSLQGRGAESERLMASLTHQAVTDSAKARLACARLDNYVFHLGRIEAGLALAEEAEKELTEPEWRDEVAARRGAVVSGTFGPRAHLEAFGELPARASGRAFVYASITSSNALARVGRLEAARETAERAYSAQLTLTEPFEWYPWTHIFFRNEALAHEGRINEAVALATAQYEQSLLDRSPEAQAWFAWQLSMRVSDRGQPESGARFGREAVALFRQLGWPLFEHLALLHLTIALALGGHAEESRAAIARDNALALPADCYFVVDIHQSRAWSAVACGDLPTARDGFRTAAEVGRDVGDRVGEATALHALARIGYADEALAPIQDVAPLIEGALTAARARHTTALATRDPVTLEEVSEQFAAMGAALLAAEAAADAAVGWRQRDDPRRASRWEGRASALARHCGNPASPALQAIKWRSRLTRAERETAMLAVAGRSNKQIAEQLGISVRTVENHLQHSYEKLGVCGRSELAEGLENAAEPD